MWCEFFLSFWKKCEFFRIFCTYAGAALFFCYIYFITFFAAVMCIAADRESKNSHCFVQGDVVVKEEVEHGMSKI